MYYDFVDGQYLGSSKHVAYLKKRVDEDMALGGFQIGRASWRERVCQYV